MDITSKKMNLKQLKYFCAIVEKKGLNAAAETLFVTPTAISMQLLRLEDYLGGVLFDRSKKPMELTSLGRFFYPRAKELLQEINRLDRETKDIIKGKKEWLRIGFTRSVIISLLPETIKRFKRKYTNVHLDLVEILSEYQADSLRNDKIDIAISRFIGLHEKEAKLTAHKLLEDPFVVAVSTSNPLACRTELSMRDLQNYPLILYPKDVKSHFGQQILSLFQLSKLNPTIAYEAIEIHTALALVGADLGITLVGASVAQNNRQDVRFIPVTDVPQSTALLVYTRENETNPLVNEFLKLLRHEINRLENNAVSLTKNKS